MSSVSEYLDLRYLKIAISISSPPSSVSPFVPITLNIPFSKDKIETSKVPPPKS